MILFVDFNGTLHPTWEVLLDASGKEVARPYEGPRLIEAPILASLIAPFGDRIEVVISSFLAYTKCLDEIRSMPPAEIAGRTVDSIWLPELITSVWSEYRSKQATPYARIWLWLDRRRPGYVGPWLALDDADQPWPEGERHHLVHAAGTLGDHRFNWICCGD